MFHQMATNELTVLTENIIKGIDEVCLSEGATLPLLITEMPGDYPHMRYPVDKLIEEVYLLRVGFPVLLLTALDIHYLNLEYVFGFTDLLKRVSIVSLARLKRGASTDKVIDRAVKTAIHEIGHLNGLMHCRSRRCVMSLSFGLSDTDRKGRGFCDGCRNTLKINLNASNQG